MSVQRRQWLRRCSVLVLVAGSLASGPVRAQGLEVRSNKVLNDVELELRIESVNGSLTAVAGVDRPDVRVGTRLLVCFRASRDGHVTLLSRPEGPLGLNRIYPNRYVEGVELMRPIKSIEGGQARICASGERKTHSTWKWQGPLADPGSVGATRGRKRTISMRRRIMPRGIWSSKWSSDGSYRQQHRR